jgi:hypothetical protein
MSEPIPLFEVNRSLDTRSLAARFSRDRRLQIRNVLSERSARTIQTILARQTPWGLAWRAAQDGPHGLRREQVKAMAPHEHQALGNRVMQALAGEDYGFVYAQYPLLDAYLEGWNPDGPHDLIMEHINDDPFMNLVREVTDMPELIKADAQATLYAPGHFLGVHDDTHVSEGWRIAYVLNLCAADWRPDWGGYLMFYDDDGDVVAGFKPRFNSLNLFAVPQRHNVTFVPAFAPVARYAITGWFRDR